MRRSCVALYDGSTQATIATEVTFEDGRKGVHHRPRRDPRHRPAGRHGEGRVKARARTAALEPAPRRRAAVRARGQVDVAAGEAILSVENVSLAFGGVKALSDVSFDIRKGEIRAIIGPNGAGKTSMLNVINGFYQPQHGRIAFKGKQRSQMRPYEAARGGIARTFQNVALFRGMTALDNIMAGRSLAMQREFLLAAPALRAGTGRRGRAPEARRGNHRFPGDRHIRKVQVGRCRMDCRSASSSAARSPWSPTSCCSTSRWPA